MIWAILGCLALGIGLCVVGGIAANSRNPDNRSAAPLYVLPGGLLIVAAIVLAIGNAAVQALL